MDNLAYKLGSRAVSNRYRTNQNDKVRVCFYGRVSTQHEAQINALDNQLQWYESVLKDHPNWEKVKVYVDKGISGTQAKKRHGFMQMRQKEGLTLSVHVRFQDLPVIPLTVWTILED